MRRIIERYRRKDTCRPERCTPIVLGAQTFFLPHPWLEIRPVFVGGKATLGSQVYTWGAELDTLLDLIAAEPDPASRIFAILTLAALMLQRNYDLTDAECEHLLIYRSDDPASREMVDTIMSAATGGLFADTLTPLQNQAG